MTEEVGQIEGHTVVEQEQVKLARGETIEIQVWPEDNAGVKMAGLRISRQADGRVMVDVPRINDGKKVDDKRMEMKDTDRWLIAVEPQPQVDQPIRQGILPWEKIARVHVPGTLQGNVAVVAFSPTQETVEINRSPHAGQPYIFWQRVG